MDRTADLSCRDGDLAFAPADGTWGAQDGDNLTPAFEWCSGPLHGLYSACYVVHTGDDFVGYAKLCTKRPANAWSTTSGIAKIGSRAYPTVQQAIDGLNRKVERALAVRRARVLDRFLAGFRR